MKASIRKFLLLSGLVLWAGGASGDETYHLDIQAQDLPTALKSFAEQSGLQVVFFAVVTDGEQTRGVNGAYTADAALAELLSGTGLEYSSLEEDTYAITRPGDQEDDQVEPGKNQPVTGQLTMAQSPATTTERERATANANEHGEGKDPRPIEEIIVTALKRSQSLQDIPLSVKAFSQEMLEDAGSRQFADFLHGVAGLSYDQRGPGRSSFVIRGVSPVSGVATVGIYIDDMPATDSRYQPEISMLDVERVEILRGPQGTLYGEGSMGGIIRVITNQADPTAFSAFADMAVSSTHNGGFNTAFGGMVNLPVVEDEFALRFSAYLDDTDGWIDNVAPGLADDGVNDESLEGGRLQAYWSPTERLRLTAMYLHQEIDLDGLSYTSPEAGDLEQQIYVDEWASDEIDQFNLTVDYDFSWGALTASTSYLNREHGERNERSYLFFPAIVPTYGRNQIETDVFNEEIRISSNPGRWQWLAGLYFKSTRDDELRFLSFDFEGGTVFDQTLDSESDQRAAFGELSFNFTESLQGTVGLRYFEEDLELTEHTAASPAFGIPEAIRNKEGDFDKVSSKFVLSYEPDPDQLFYASASEGFRSGGFNVALLDPSLPDEYDPDSTWNYEIGAKTVWNDGRLVLNAALYYIEWSDMQILVRDPEVLITYTANAGKARSKGGEIELSARPSDGLEFTFGASYIDAYLTENSILAPADTSLANVVDWTVHGAVQYRFDLMNELEGFFRGGVTHVGDSYFSVEAFQREPQGDYTVGDLKLGVESEHWSAYLFVKNLWDERARLTVFPGNENVNFGGEIYRNQPRTIGASVRWQF